jgi:hypothetical protein
MINLTYPLSTAARAGQTATRFRLAILVSIALHAAMLWELPALSRLRPGPTEPEPHSLNVRLAPAPSPPAQAAATPRERASAAARPAPRASTERPAPPPATPPAVAAAPALAPAPAVRPAEPDLMAYVEARRRERAASAPEPRREVPAPPLESENERASRAAAANLGASRAIVFGHDPGRSGGVFQIERLSTDYAEVSFVGWHASARRQMKQTLEVRRGAHSDIRIAVVRSIIAVIRQHEPEEFSWDSHRLGRTLTLSSAPRDNAGLEDFMMLEFFSGPRPIYRGG